MISSRGKYKRANLKQWCNFLNSKPSDTVIVDHVLKDSLAKIGYFPDYNPASLFDVQQMWDALEDYGSGFNADLDYFNEIPEFRQAIKVAYKVFGSKGQKLEPITGEIELYSLIKKDSSAGIPYMTSKDKAFPTSYMRMKDVKENKKAFNPCLAQFRTQRKKDDFGKPIGKTRNVFAYPFDATLYEAQYFYPLQKALLKRRTSYCGGLWRSELGSRLKSSLDKRFIYEFDYSRFDAKVPLGIIRAAFYIIKTWFDKQFHHEIDKIFRYFVHTPIVMPDQHLYVGKEKGIPSGSNFTQIVGSICNFIFSFAVSYKFNLRINWYSSHFVGDDGIFSSDKNVSLSAISLYLKQFGMILSPGKSRKIDRTSSEPHFVGFTFRNGLPTKPLQEVVTNLCYPERPRKYDDGDEHANMLIRQMGLLSLEAVDIVRKRVNSYNNGGFIEWFKHNSPKSESGSDFLAYRNKYILKENNYMNIISMDYLK